MDNKPVFDYLIEDYIYNDIKVLNVGEEICESAHSYGPAVRPYHLIHFVLSGKGIFQTADKTFTLSAGQAFIIYPDIVTFYQADTEDPWHYVWLGFEGTIARKYISMCGFSKDNPIYTPLEPSVNGIKNIFKDIFSQRDNKIFIIGLTHLFFNNLIQNTSNPNPEKRIDPTKQYITKIINHITYNYWNDIKVSQLAELCNIDRSYCSRIFKDSIGISIQKYIINYKLDRAKEILTNSNVSISDCGRSVGYDDSLAFSKIFKKFIGVSPREYRKIKKSNE